VSQATTFIKQVLILATAQTLLIFQTPIAPKPTRTTSGEVVVLVVLVGLGAIFGK